ncbi:MAG TPA: hypothetical protein VIX17_11800 [Pyrinomonadaceae bacterium]|jgi:hypothetical protein
MKVNASILCFALGICLSTTGVSAIPAAVEPPQTPDHGGVIETKYDGFTRETVVSLKKMTVSCAGMKGNFTESCVSMAVSLHCPGIQLENVRTVTLELEFAAKDWGQRHPLAQRELTIVADTTTFKAGQMRLVSQTVSVPMRETFEVDMSYAAYRRIAAAEAIEMQLGQSRFELRDKNILALRDLKNRVRVKV